MASKYLPIWNTLKEKGYVRITAPQRYHRTIIKMVKNRRDKDKAYLYLLAEENLTHRLKITSHESIIEFTLTRQCKLTGL